MHISFIVAADEKNGMGRKGQLPWHLPADFRFFKETTKGHHILMGRKTFQSLGKPLPLRTNIIITRQADYQPEGTVVFHSIQEGIAFARRNGEENLFIIGGAEVFKESFSQADLLYLTRVYGVFEADTFFPEFSEKDWELVSESLHPADEKHVVPFTFQLWRRKEG